MNRIVVIIIFWLCLMQGRALAQSPALIQSNPLLKNKKVRFYSSRETDTIHIRQNSVPGDFNQISDLKKKQSVIRIQKMISGLSSDLSSTKTTSVIAGAISMTITTTNTTCGYYNGTMSITAVGGTAPYTYSANGSPFQPEAAFTGLAAGPYTIAVKDADGNTGGGTVVVMNIFDPPSVMVSGFSNETTCGGTDGTVTLAGSGGTGPYRFSMDMINYQTANIFTNLSAGQYTFFVQDGNGCVASVQYQTSGTPCLSFDFNYSHMVCGNDGFISVDPIAGGTPPYIFSLDGINFTANKDFNNLTAGMYHVFIKDANGLQANFALTLFNYCPVSITASVVDPTCGSNNGLIIATASNGTIPYLYSLDGIVFKPGSVFNNLPAGTYNVTVKDASKTIVTINNIVLDAHCPTVIAAAVNETCSQGNGSITATGSSGNLPYAYSLDAMNFQASAVFPNLAKGNYTVTIKDGFGNMNATSASVDNICDSIKVVITNASCGNNNARIEATGSDGFPPYSFSLDAVNYQTSGVFANLASGNYTVYVKDTRGLINSTTALITNTVVPQLAVQNTSAGCSNNDGTITALATSGTPPLLYSLDGINFQNSNIFGALPNADYTITVRDFYGCTASALATVPILNNLFVNAGTDTTVCAGTGFAIAASSNATSFTWSPAAGLSNTQSLHPVATPVATTVYTLTASTGSCTVTDQIAVMVNPAPVPNTGGDVEVCYGKNIQLNGSGGVVYHWTPATYLSDPNISNPVVNNPANNITYTLNVTDAFGCRSATGVPLTVRVISAEGLFAGNDTSVNKNSSIVLHATDLHNAGFTDFSWSPAGGLNDPNIANPVAVIDQNITYTVTAVTAAGCEATASVNIKILAGPAMYVPNAFTPNNDGHNDVLRVIAIGIREFRYLDIYNRWGQRVFHSQDPGQGWDGTFGGQAQTPSAFVYITEGVDYEGHVIRQKGSVLLIR